MSSLESPRYEHTDSQVADAAKTAVDYVFVGGNFMKPFDMRGLVVFGVIGALRENDERLHGEDANLDDEQKARLAEVEGTIDAAVGERMQYYPFGEKQNKWNIDKQTMARLAGLQNRSEPVRETRTRNVARRTRIALVEKEKLKGRN